MRFFPYEKYKLKTALSPIQVSQKIYENIDAGQMLTSPTSRPNSRNKIEGFVNKREFEINSKRYNLEPTIVIILLGLIEETESGSEIIIKSYFFPITYFFIFLIPG